LLTKTINEKKSGNKIKLMYEKLKGWNENTVKLPRQKGMTYITINRLSRILFII
tara:strand:- start:477 stop:638 length:162 start_codon:yes stop_codon:yes gene_type:complete